MGATAAGTPSLVQGCPSSLPELFPDKPQWIAGNSRHQRMLEGTPGSLAPVEACSETLLILVALRRRVHGGARARADADYSPRKKKEAKQRQARKGARCLRHIRSCLAPYSNYPIDTQTGVV